MIEVEGLRLYAGSFELRGIDLRVESGEYFALLGPTGAGKSLFLKCLCGLIRVHGGRIVLDGRDVTYAAPRERQIGYVPQDYGLFPHLSAEANIEFGLRARGVPRRERRQRVASLVELLQIEHLTHRYPTTLSGGERQRVALARALAIEPKLLLLDEPVSALDESTRDRVCFQLREVQQTLRVPTIHVCHNLEEALTVADRAGIIQNGEIVQTGPLREMLHSPRSERVARFLRRENVFAGRAIPSDDGYVFVEFEGHRLATSAKALSENVKFLIRPEAIRVEPTEASEASAFPNRLRATLTRVVDRGHYCRLEFDAGVSLVVYCCANNAACEFRSGESYTLTVPPEAIHFLDE